MLDFLWAVIAFIVAIGILVTFHEYGHFWVARRLGVKVLRFSIGFGKPIWKRTTKSGLEFVIAMIPLGGYVKMLDESEGKVAAEDVPHAFNRKSVWTRMLIVLAGPFFNFIFAVLAYWLIFSIGTTVVAPIIGATQSQSIAGKAGLGHGDELVRVDGQSVKDWREVNLVLITHLGKTGQVKVTYKPIHSNQIKNTSLDLAQWQVDSKRPDILGSLGFTPYYPKLSTEIAKVVPDGAASKAGIKAKDKIMSINGKPVTEWSEIGPILDKHINQTVPIKIKRGNTDLQLMITPKGLKQTNGLDKAIIGIYSVPLVWPKQYLRTIRYPVTTAFWYGIKKTWHMTALTAQMLYKMVVGQISVRSISGPVGIAQIAGYSAQKGFNYFLSFLALISISLGVINLLPVPMLDGGHFFYYVIEVIRGKPLSTQAQVMGFKIGLILLLALMFFAISNDITRIF